MKEILGKTAALAVALCAGSLLAGPKVSIIGDSYSTYQSWGATYYPRADAGVTSVEQTWWSQVIAGIGFIGAGNSS